MCKFKFSNRTYRRILTIFLLIKITAHPSYTLYYQCAIYKNLAVSEISNNLDQGATGYTTREAAR